MTSKHVMIGPMTCPTCNAALPEYDELRAEIERLKAEILGERQGTNRVVEHNARTIHDLRAEVERLKRLYDDVYAENQRLNQAMDMLAAEREAWEADNERLRAFVGRVVGAYAVDEWIAEEGQRLLDHA